METIQMGPTPWPGAVLVATAAETRMWSAYHEAGHAVRAIAWQRPVAFVTIEPDLAKLGGDPTATGAAVHLNAPPEDWSEVEIKEALCISIAGTVAEEKFRRGRRQCLLEWEVQHLEHGAGSDREYQRELLTRLGYDEPDGRIVHWRWENVEDWMGDPEVWSSIQLVARALNHPGTLSGLQLGAALQRHTFRGGAPTATPPTP